MRSFKTGSGAKKTINYLHYTLHYSVKTSRKIIWAYGKSIGIEKLAGIDSVADFIKLGDIIQKDWDAFMTFYGTIKDTYKKAGKSSRSRSGWDSYDADITEALQYTNGCTDDF